MRRQQHVFKPDMVAHLWANRSLDHARVAHGNFWFTGPALYSYGNHYVVGFHMPKAYDRDGAAVVIDRAYVDSHLGELVQDPDLSRYIL